MSRLSVIALLVISCVISGCSSPKDKPVIVAPPKMEPTPTQPPTATTALPPAEPGSLYGFAASPLTPFADKVTTMALAALAGTPPRELPFRNRSKRPLVQWRPGAAETKLEVLGFAMELEVFAESSAGGPPERIRLVLFVSEHGLKILNLSVRSGGRAEQLPAWLNAAGAAANLIMDSAKRGELSALLLGEDEKPLFGDHYKEIEDELPSAEAIDKAHALARGSAGIVGYDIDDVNVLARDDAGGLYVLRLEIEGRGEEMYFDGPPLVRVKRLDRRR